MYKKLFFITILILLFFYLSVVFLLPKVLNSIKFQNFISNFLEDKFNLDIDFKNIKFKIDYKLKSNLNINKLKVKSKNSNKHIFLSNFDITTSNFGYSPEVLKADFIYLNLSKQNKTKSNNSYDIKSIKSADVKKAVIIFNSKNNVILNDFYGYTKNKQTIFSANAIINSNRLKRHLKFDNSNKIIVESNVVYFNNFKILLEKSVFNLDGFIKNKKEFEIAIRAKNVPVLMVKQYFLYYMKSIKPDKNFIENFYDFKGLADFNLKIGYKRIDGTINLKDFFAKSIKFDVPFYFPEGVFYFKKDNVFNDAIGTFGGYKLTHKLRAVRIFSKTKVVEGDLKSIVENDFAKKYVDGMEIIGKLPLEVIYHIENKTPKVKYFADINKDTVLSYKGYSTAKLNSNRRIFVQTVKSNYDLVLKHYDYSIIEGSKIKNIIFGDGFFSRKNGVSKYVFEFLTIKSAGFINSKLLGKYKNMELDGKAFFDILLKSRSIIISDIKLFLKEFEIKPFKNNDFSSSDSNFLKNLIVYSAEVKLDKLKYKNFVAKNLSLEAFLKSSVSYFNITNVSFLNGFVDVFGEFDINKSSYSINFIFKDIAVSSLYRSFCPYLKCSYNSFLYKLNKYTNIDINKLLSLKSLINGEFTLNNGKMKNIALYNQNKHASFFLEGDYDFKNKDIDLTLWAKYNSCAISNLRVLFLPLSFVISFVFKDEYCKDITKINKIPNASTNFLKNKIVNARFLGSINDLKIYLNRIK